MIGSNTINEWILDSGVNQGRINFDGQSLDFFQVNNLVGGNLQDTFTLNGGQIDGTIDGGVGNDILDYVVLTEGVTETRATDFFGGAGNDIVNISGGAGSFEGNFSTGEIPSDDPINIGPIVRDSIAFNSTDLGDVEQIVRYSGVTEVNQRATTGEFIVNGTEEADTITLATSAFSVNDTTAVTYDNATSNLTVNAGTTDTIQVSENVVLTGTLSLLNGAVESDAGAQIQAQTLALEGVRNAGSADTPLETDVTELIMRDLSGDVFIQEANTLVLGETKIAGNVNLVVDNGDLSQSAAAEASGTLNIDVKNGGIRLDQEQNQITAKLGLISPETVVLKNTTATDFATVSAGALEVDSEQSIVDSGLITVGGDTILGTRGDIDLDTAENDFANVSVTEAVNINLIDSNALRLNGAQASGNISLFATDIELDGNVNALSLTGTALNSVTVEENGFLTADNFIELNGTAVEIIGNVSSTDVLLDGTTGDVNIRGGVLSSNSTTLRGNNVNLLNAVASDGDLVIGATGDVNQSQSVTTGGRYTIEGSAQNAILGAVVADSMSVSAQNVVEQKGDIQTTQDAIIVAGRFIADTTSSINTSEGSASITSTSDLNSGVINAGSNVSLISTEGTLTVASAINAGNQVSMNGASSLQINSAVTGVNGVVFGSDGNATLNGVLQSEAGVVDGDVVGDIVMTANGQVVSINGDIDLNAGGDILLTQLRALEGNTTLAAGKGIIDNDLDGLEEPVNIETITLNSTSVDGFGANNAIETSVFEVNVTNGTGRIDLVNSGKTLLVSALLNNGDISLVNEGNAFFPAGAVNTFYDPDLPLNPRVGDIPRPGGSFSFVINGRGALVNLGAIDVNNPNISAVSTNILTPAGFFGGPGVPPVIYSENELAITASTILNDPIFGFCIAPTSDAVFTAATPTNLNEIGAGEQIVQVETLEQVDPAIFTSINNYFYQDVSILLPEDQRYDELEDDEDEI